MTATSPPVLQAYCPVCREMAMPDDHGRCVWCGTPTGAPASELDAPIAPERWHLRKGEPGYGPECPKCGGPKGAQSRQCASCRTAGGHRGPTRKGNTLHRAYLIDEETLLEARRLYATGLSLRKVADVIFERTSYSSTAGCAQQLHSLFRHRGWRLRPQRAVTAARNYRHGRGGRDRDEGAYRRFLREEGGGGYHGPYRPRCTGFRTQYPGKGRPCQRPAMTDSEFCSSHDPARAADRERHLASMRARRAA